MSEVLKTLKAFNRKERYFLVRQVIGDPEFKLCDDFRKILNLKFSLNIPQNAYTAMDYHLDWIYATLELSKDKGFEIRSNENRIIHASAEDIDFLVAFEDAGICHMIFLEAKGVTLFANEQLVHKIKRLTDFFGQEGNKYPEVIPHFAIVSPKEPQKIKYEDWPLWAYPNGKVKWIEMKIDHGMQKVVRCDGQGNDDKKGFFLENRTGRVLTENADTIEFIVLLTLTCHGVSLPIATHQIMAMQSH